MNRAFFDTLAPFCYFFIIHCIDSNNIYMLL